jgi:hypothetical protein
MARAQAIEETRNQATSPWTEEKTVRLEKLYADGVSFRDIAADIGGVTRNAVIGKVHRMQLEPRREPVVIKKKPLIFVVPQPRRRSRSKVNFTVTKPPEPEPVPGKDYSCKITELTDTTCRYPLWKFDAATYSDKFYCGAPGAELSIGQPYCRKHARLCNPQRQ